MKKLPLLLIFLAACTQLSAQYHTRNNADKKAVILLDQALQRAEDGNLPLTVGLLQQSIEQDPLFIDAYLAMAGAYNQLKNYKNAVTYYEKAFAIDTSYTMDYKFSYSINLAGIGEFKKALDAINELLEKRPPKNSNSLKGAQYRKRCYEFAVNYAATHPSNYVFAPQNMGSNINTAESEYFPSLTIDGKELVFTRKLGGINEDFFHSSSVNNQWDKAKPIEGDVNTPMNEGAQNISQDGQWLVFTGCDRRGGFGGCDLYMSYLVNNKWSDAVNLGSNINSDQWESQPCLSPDKHDLYFASRRPGGYGGSDIYVSHIQTDGSWGVPENLGPDVNSAGDELCPFMHADNQMLYFTSDYWPGYGDQDLFYIKKGPGNTWSKPVNLGYPINTINNEATLFISADAKTAYYASDRSDSKGGLDIYSFELREDVRPHRTLWVKGQVMDKKTKKGLSAGVELIDLASKQLISKVQTDEEGHYLVTLPVGSDYAFNVSHKGYLFYSDNFSLSKQPRDSVYEKNILLQPIEINASVVLKNIFFESNQYSLSPASQVELDRVVQLLNDNPTVRILISGHTDNVGKPPANLTLSNNRAKAVVSYLNSKGIALTRLSFKGFGETQPITPNTTEEGRATNRRTEMKVIAR